MQLRQSIKPYFNVATRYNAMQLRLCIGSLLTVASVNERLSATPFIAYQHTVGNLPWPPAAMQCTDSTLTARPDHR